MIFGLIFTLHSATRRNCLFSELDTDEYILNVPFFSYSSPNKTDHLFSIFISMDRNPYIRVLMVKC